MGPGLFLIYIVLQNFIPRKLPKYWKVAAGLPLLVMFFFVSGAIVAFTNNVNIWPLIQTSVCPIAIVYLLVLFGIYKLTQKLSKKQNNETAS